MRRLGEVGVVCGGDKGMDRIGKGKERKARRRERELGIGNWREGAFEVFC